MKSKYPRVSLPNYPAPSTSYAAPAHETRGDFTPHAAPRLYFRRNAYPLLTLYRPAAQMNERERGISATLPLPTTNTVNTKYLRKKWFILGDRVC